MTISEFVQQQGAQLRVFDLGRRIEALPNDVFHAVEHHQLPYPIPYLKHAWLGILTWKEDAPGSHNIWFAKLPLDEQNLLEPAARDAFLQHWLRVQAHPQQQHGEAPYGYRPDAQRMAYFHAKVLKDLAQPPTQFYTTTRAYLSGDLGWENWQQLGLQGLADVVVRLDEDHNHTLLAQALSQLPAVPRNVLLGFLENAEPDQVLTSAINDALAQCVADAPSANDLALFARALSASVNVEQRGQLFAALLQHPQARNVELLAALGSRCWRDLHGELLLQYLEALVRNEQGMNAFNALVADFLALPEGRQRFMDAVSLPTVSDELKAAVAGLFALVRAGNSVQ